MVKGCPLVSHEEFSGTSHRPRPKKQKKQTTCATSAVGLPIKKATWAWLRWGQNTQVSCTWDRWHTHTKLRMHPFVKSAPQQLQSGANPTNKLVHEMFFTPSLASLVAHLLQVVHWASHCQVFLPATKYGPNS